MAIYNLKLLERKEITQDTIVYTFEKPQGFSFKPGQYAGFTIISPKETDAGGNTRRFSLLSSPNEPFITIATRRQNSAYKRMLDAIPVGGEIKFAGPTGNFVLHADSSVPGVFIAGGIGITPFYSMLKYATEIKSKQNLILFYGNNSIDDAVFLNELFDLQKNNPHITIIPTLALSNSDWSGEIGFIDDVVLNKYIKNLDAPIYYICGSPVMVTTLQETLAEMGINEDNIRVEDFPGY